MIILPISEIGFETKLLMAALDMVSKIMYIPAYILQNLMKLEVDTKADALHMYLYMKQKII